MHSPGINQQNRPICFQDRLLTARGEIEGA